MAPTHSRSPSLRRGLAAALLTITAVSMAATLSLEEAARRARLLWRSLVGETVSSREQTGFWFDSEYAAFLEEVRRRTPPNATIAIVVPPRPDVYVYQAAYQLSPRRVVQEDRKSEASYVAAYRSAESEPADPRAIKFPNGVLIQR